MIALSLPDICSKPQNQVRSKADSHLSGSSVNCFLSNAGGEWQMVRRCWVNIQCRGVLLIWMVVGKGPIALAVGASGVDWHVFFLFSFFLFLGD